MSTVCTKNKTLIDHCAISFQTKNNLEMKHIILKIKYLMRRFKIRVGINKPQLTHKFTAGNILYCDYMAKNNKSVGSIKINYHDSLVKLELNGSLCSYIQLEDEGFSAIYEFSKAYCGIIRRLDICLDDKSGKYNLRRVQQDYSSGKYNSKSGPKLSSETHCSSSGRTKYLGSKLTYKFVRIYEKGKELKLAKNDPEYKNWTRHEVVLKNQGKVLIPLEALINPDGIFVSSFPKAHRKMLKNCEPLNVEKIVAKEVSTTLLQKTLTLKKMGGRTIDLIRSVIDDDTKTLDTICRDGQLSTLSIPDKLNRDILKEQFDELLTYANNGA